MASTTITSVTAKPYYPRALRQKYRLTLINDDSSHQSSYADISFHPDWNQFQARSQRNLSASRSQRLPAGWPMQISSPSTWTASDFAGDEAFIHHLTEDELGDIHKALSRYKALGLPANDVTRAVFPLPRFEAKLAELRDDVYNGIGCRVLRGLEVARYSAEDLSIILCGVSSYMADTRGKQDQDGSLIKHIVDFDSGESNVDLPFHTDVVCDVVAMLTRACSDRGGMGTLASGSAVYNHLAATRPDLIQVLAEPNWPLDTYGRAPAYYNRALLYHVGGRVIFNFSRRILTGHPLNPRTEGIPGLTERQAEALDALHYAAQAQQTCVSVQKGDIRFVNNMALLHGRQAFADDGSTPRLSKRHLIRLWLHDSQRGMTLPPELQLAWDRTFFDDERSTRWDPEPPRDKDGKLFGIQLTACD